MNFYMRMETKFLFLIFILFGNIFCYAESPLKICLTGSDVDTLPIYGQSFINGADLAKIQNNAENIQIIPYFYNRQPLQALRTYQQMQKDGCNAVIGFDSLTDLNLVARFQKSPYIPIFTPYASDISADKMPQNIFIFMPSYDFLAKQMIKFFEKHYKLKKVLIITAVNRDEMLSYKTVYSQLLINQKITVDTFDFLEDDSQTQQKFSQFLNNKKFDYAFLLTTAPNAANFVQTMNSPKTIYIGTEFFGSSAQPSFYVALKNKNIHAYFIRNLDYLKPNKLLDNFQNEYNNIFHEHATILSAYAYDAAMIIIKTANKYNIVNSSNILQIHYNGITGIKISKGKFYRSNYFLILANSTNGYSYEK